ncbi:MAG: ABC transporter ATP-binding protein [Anaerolineae bacterium]|nr:ABC transporter ATP-binding protein [Anaerolineae bacterium]
MIHLEARALHFGYNGHAVLQAVDLRAEPGEVLVIIGPNGAGKTTLLKLMAGILRPRAGFALVDGRDARRLHARERARALGLVPQLESQAWPLTVWQLVALGRAPHRGWVMPLNEHDRATVERVLERTSLTNLRDRPVAALSGGERQLVLIARALAQEPAALLLDEPTSHLDLRHQATLLGLVRSLAHDDNLTVVMTLHDVNQAALYADRMALLDNGALRAVGTPHDVLRADLLSEVYGVPITVSAHPLHGTPMVAPVLTSAPAAVAEEA